MTKAKQQREEEMERLNSKYNLDCYSDSELDSESDEGEQYHAMNMAMRPSYEKCKNEFVRLIFTKISFSKTNMLVEFSKYK